MKAVGVLLLTVGLVLVAGKPRHDLSRDNNGAQVYRVKAPSVAALSYLQYLQRNSQLDFWTEPKRIGTVDIMARRWDIPLLKSALKNRNLDYSVMISDVAALIEKNRLENEKARGANPRVDWQAYYTYDEIETWLDELVAANPDIATIINVGTSYEGRQMRMLKLSTGGVKEAIFTDGGIHAREWISPATVTYFIDQLVNSADKTLIDSVDFYFMFSINPDGYDYSWTNDRLWRKTRSINEGSPCIGTDPNRNWDFHWMEGGASDLPCAETYAGPFPFSEVENQNVRDQLLAIQPRVYLTFHAYSQLWMYPWGYTSNLPANWQDLDALAQDAVFALTAVYGTQYEIGSSTNTIYIAAGGSDDWALGVEVSEYAYTIELRDTGRYGFELPPDQILPTAAETYEGFKVVAQFVRDNPKLPSSSN